MQGFKKIHKKKTTKGFSRKMHLGGGGGGGSPELFLKGTTQETKIILRYHQRNRISNILPHQGIRYYFSIIIKTEVSV